VQKDTVKGKSPLQTLRDSLNHRVVVEMRGSKQYRGILDGFDNHMNLLIRKGEEYEGDDLKGSRRLVVVRGDTVVYIAPGSKE